MGELLRQWREQRRLSQLELAGRAAISARHLSFVETGRSAPSRDMVLRLADRLDVPLRERNHLLLAAGFAPVYPEAALDSPEMAAVRTALRQLLTGHEPYPAVVVDRHWNLVEANAPVALFTAYSAPWLRDLRPINVLRVSLHPDGMARRIINLGEWRAHLLGRLGRQVSRSGERELVDLYAEVSGYLCDQAQPDVDLPGPGDVVVPLRIRHRDRDLCFISTVATFGTPLDVTVAELSIESFFPADPATATYLRERAEKRGASSRAT